jgi:EmrB/QacA subfamily drug resistance transporter
MVTMTESSQLPSGQQQPSSTPFSGMSTARTVAAFCVMLFGAMCGGLAQTATNTSLSSIMAAFSVPVTLAQWLTTVYTLCLGVVIPLSAFLSRRFTIRQLFLFAISLFCVGSMLVSFAPNFTILFVGRACEATATGILYPIMQLVALLYFPIGRRGTVMGIVGLTMGFAPNIGPTIAGLLDTTFGWRACYLFLSVYAACVLVLGLLFVRWDSRTLDPEASGFDVPSLLFSTIGFGSLLLSLSNASSQPVASVLVWLPLLVGIACLVLFTRRQLTLEHPFLNLQVFRWRQFTIGTCIICMLFGAFIGVSLVIPLHIQEVLMRSSLESGLVLLPGTIAAAVASPLAGILMDHIEARYVMLGAAMVLVVSTFMLVDMGNVESLRYLATWQCLRTFGISALIMPVTTWSVNTLDKRLMADGTSVTNALRQIAAAVSTTAMVLIMTAGSSTQQVSAAGVNGALHLSLVLSLGILVLIIAFVKRERVGPTS